MPTYKIYDEESYETLYRKIKEYFYRKSELYNKTQIDSMLSSALKFTIVQSLPEVGENGTIYLVPKQVPSQDDVYDEYIWTSTQGQIQQHYEHIGSTQIDLSNYYNKSEVDSLLNGKQASITITNSDTTPVDTTNVIMQNSGSGSTTSFLRMTMQTIRGYFNNWLYRLINLPYSSFYGGNRRFDAHVHGLFWGADKRFVVTWKTYNSQTQEVVFEATDSMKANLFNESAENGGVHPVDGEYDVITIEPKDGQTKIIQGSYGQGNLLLVFYYNSYPSVAPTIRIYGGQSGQKTWTTLSAPTKPSDSVFQYELTQGPALYLEKIEITIQGRTNGTGSARGAHLSNIDFIGLRSSIIAMSAVTKYAVDQQLYGNVTAPKFIMRGGTASQALLADGTTLSIPVPVNNGGTGSTTAIGAEYNILNQVADSTAQLADLNDNRKIALCNITKSSTNGVFRWMTLGLLWNYIKNKISSVLGIDENSLNSKVNLLADFTINSIAYSSSNVGKYQKLIRFPRGSTIIINVIRNHTMYGRTDSHTNMLIIDGYSSGSNYVTTLTQSDLRVVNEGNYSFVICPCASYYGSPIFTYRLQILFSSVSIDNIEAVESSVIISASPRDNFVIYNKPVTLGSYTFNMSGSSTNLYLVQGEDHFYSFIGNVTGTINENYSIYLRDVEIGQVYQFVFTEDIPAGLKFVDDDNYYDACTIPTTIGAGDTLTLTAASATQDGWLYSIQKFEIESPDESIDVKYSNGITQLEVSKRFVKNNAEYYYEDDEQIAIGSYAKTLKLTGEGGTSRFAYTKNFTLSSFKVDGGSSEYYHILSSGTTYTITIGNTSIQYTPQTTGCLVVVYSGSYDLYGYDLGFFASNNSYDSYYINNLQVNGSNSLCLLDTTSGSILSLLDSQTIVKCWYKNSVVAMCTAVGDMAEATGIYTSAFGYYARAINEHCVAIAYASLAIGINSIAIGSSSKSSGSGSIALGNRSIAKNTSCVAIGFNSTATANSSVAIGPNSSSTGNQAVAIGLYASSVGTYAIAIGNNASSSESYAIAIGQSAIASQLRAIAIGYGSQSSAFDSIAIGWNVRCLSSDSVAIGSGSKVDEGNSYSVAIGGAIVDKNCQYSIAIGEGSIAKAVSSMAIGDGAAAYGLNSMFLGKGYSTNERNVGVGINSSVGSINTDYLDNSQYPYLTIRRFDGVPFECDDQIVYNRKLSSDATIIVDGHTYMIFAIPNKQIVVVNDSNAANIKYGSANDYNYFIVDGVPIYTQYATQIAEVNHLHDNYYYIVLSCYESNYSIGTNSFTFYPLVKSSVNYQNSCVFGNKCFTYHSNSIALGVSCSTAKENQMVIGNFNEINDSSKFIIGGGTEFVRRNILEIDNDERLKVNSAIISGVSSINSSQTQTLNNITKSVYKINRSTSGTISLTLSTSGCVEGQRVSIFAETNDVLVVGCTNPIPQGRFADFLFLSGSWVPMIGL